MRLFLILLTIHVCIMIQLIKIGIHHVTHSRGNVIFFSSLESSVSSFLSM